MDKEEIESTRWAIGFKADCPTQYRKAIDYALNDKLTIHLYKNNEINIDKWFWTIAAFIDGKETGFWMDSFKTKKEALLLCKNMGWKIKK